MSASHKSGGRDVWSSPSESAPADPVAATWDALGEVLDPELPVSLVDLGLIYGVSFEDGVAAVRLTYTATGCPCMEFIREDIRDRLEQETWVREVLLEEVWDPPWTTARITEQGRERLRCLGVGA
jgi:metal-sulfur cluster biosynthetic enzyme